jgi:hypothetical protein
MTLGDVLLRRLPCGWSACHALDGAGRVAEVMAERLRWSAERVKGEIVAYEREISETLIKLAAVDAQSSA